MRQQMSAETWEQIKTAYASGIGLREIARNMNASENTVLSRARREKWTQRVQTAKSVVERAHSDALTPMHSAAITMQKRGERYAERMAGVSERVLPHLESLLPDELLNNARNVEQYDRWSRRNFGLDSMQPPGGSLNLNILTNHAAVQVVAPPH